MATVTAGLTLSSEDLTSNGLVLSTPGNLKKAGFKRTNLDNTTGIARKSTTSLNQYTLFHADEFTADKAHKVYLKNTSNVASEFFTVSLDEEVMGKLYAGDFAFFPWSATDGVKQSFTLTLALTWAAGDKVVFDGVTVTTATATTTAMVDDIVAQADQYPNWIPTEASEHVVLFTARSSNNLENILEIESTGATTASVVSTTAGNGTAIIAVVQEPEANSTANDIKITPSVATTMTLEHAVLYEL